MVLLSGCLATSPYVLVDTFYSEGYDQYAISWEINVPCNPGNLIEVVCYEDTYQCGAEGFFFMYDEDEDRFVYFAQPIVLTDDNQYGYFMFQNP